MMMGSCVEEEVDQFFDTREEISSVSDWNSVCSEDCNYAIGVSDCLCDTCNYDYWTANPESVHVRRCKFLKSMGISMDHSLSEWEHSQEMGIDRITESSRAVLRSLGLEHGLLSGHSSISCSSGETMESMGSAFEENCMCTIKNLGDGTESLVDEPNQDGVFSRQLSVDSYRLVNIEDSQSGASPQQLLRRESEEARDLIDAKKKVNKGWLQKIGAAVHIAYRHGPAALKSADSEKTTGATIQRVQVHACKKNSKELSALYNGQDFLAHEGSILTMKFSLDGHYLASAGEDGIVRVWKVIEEKTLDKFDHQDIDRSCQPFTIDHLSKLASLDVKNEKMDQIKRSGRSSNWTCPIFPPKVFRIMERPVHEFQGHSGEVLDLSWSEKGYLLSSSVDMTVRLWQVGCDVCLSIFSHNNYVTSVSFNPVDDDYFISGSIDGKVRIWEVRSCKVVDYIDIREIVTAVCYRPDGKGGIVGSMTGNCLFYDIIDNRLQLDAQICLQGKKKSSGKRITGFQFSPSDPSKLMVTSADSIVRILCGMNVMYKFRGLRNAVNQTFASFTSDGKHIVSASEDSNVLVWNYNSDDKFSPRRAKSIWSCESFVSQNSSIAIPWCGITIQGTLPSPMLNTMESNLKNEKKHWNINDPNQRFLHSSPSFCFPLGHAFLSESLPKGSATWPEEQLKNSSIAAVSPAMCRSDYKIAKSPARQSMFNSPHIWSQVIVTAGWDGRIRTYLNYGSHSCQVYKWARYTSGL